MGERQAAWTELDELVARAHGRPERLGPDGVRRLGALYRAAAADLARARRAFPGDPSSVRLEQVVARARSTLYGVEPRRGSALDYLRFGYWQAVRARGRVIALAWILMLGSAALTAGWAIQDPGAAAGIAPAGFANGAAAPHHAIGLGATEAAALAVSIFTNNIGVTFLAFAAGLLIGLGPAVVLIYNGALLGVVTGIAINAGHATAVIELLLPHGILELSCIAVCAAAGMRMGWALVEPGPLTRGQALAEQAPRAVILVLCTAPWLVVAGCVEGFVTPHKLPLAAAIAVGLGIAVPYWTLVATLGRREGR